MIEEPTKTSKTALPNLILVLYGSLFVVTFVLSAGVILKGNGLILEFYTNVTL